MPRFAKIGTPTKKKTLAATERDEQERQAFRQQVAAVDRSKLIFTDETGFHLALTRAFGRAPRGERVDRSCAYEQGTQPILYRQSMLLKRF